MNVCPLGGASASFYLSDKFRKSFFILSFAFVHKRVGFLKDFIESHGISGAWNIHNAEAETALIFTEVTFLKFGQDFL